MIEIYQFTLALRLKIHVHDSKTKAPGKALHLIVTVEQLFKSPEGHLPRLAILMRRRDFQKRISRVNVDEAHFIYTAGTALYGLAAFRHAWGRLDELRVLLPASVIWAVYSATFPPHILKAVENQVMRPNYVYIHTSSNRPNITYATHEVIDTIEDPRNYECFLMNPKDFNMNEQPHVLIFVDDTKLTEKISSHLETCLPVQYRGKNIVRHYHSKMSTAYLQQAHDSFTAPDGFCRILVTTSGESVVCQLELITHSLTPSA